MIYEAMGRLALMPPFRLEPGGGSAISSWLSISLLLLACLMRLMLRYIISCSGPPRQRVTADAHSSHTFGDCCRAHGLAKMMSTMQRKAY